MNAGYDAIAEQYLSGLTRYLHGGGEAALQSAYEVGRQAMAGGLGALEMLAIHQKCLSRTLQNIRTIEETAQIVQQAGGFFSESLSPFEMALRGFREANAGLSRNLADLGSAKEQLHRQHNQLLAAHQELEAERQRYRDLFDFAPDGYLVTDLEGTIEEANRAAGELLGVPSASLTGTQLLAWVVDDQREAFHARLKRLPAETADKAQDWQFDMRSRASTSFPATLGVRAVSDSDGAPGSLRWLLRDITERKRIEEERAQLLVREQVAQAQSVAAQRFAFLADIGTLLVTSLDCEATLGTVARRIVPYLADWSLIYLVEPGSRIRLVCAAHQEPAKAQAATRLGREPVYFDPEARTARLLNEGHAEILSGPPDTRQEWMREEPELLSFLPGLAAESLLLAPMQTHGHAVGLIVLGSAQPGHYGDEHLALANDLARRCALAVENAELYRAMTAERDKAAEANRAKDEFLAVLGHELRNPLVPILGWARNLKKEPAALKGTGLSQGIETIERNALNMLRLADECLDLVRISERKVTLEKELVDLNQVLRGSIGALRQTAEEKGLRVETRLSESGIRVLGDRMRLEQVMNNLLINAIKYTGAGGVISVHSSSKQDEAHVEIQDTGIGIAPEFLEQVFEPFRRGSNQWLSSDAGLGLGLSIARRIIELHEGTIWAESAGLGRGSTFHIRLLLAPAGIALPAPGLLMSAQPLRGEALRVLLIDDHKDVTDLMKMDLETLGYTVLTATDGPMGLDLAMRVNPDVIVSDIKMPRMDGFELIQRIRRIPKLAAVPVIALTGFGMKKDVEAALAAGYDAHLNKPAEANELSDLIQKLTTERRSLRWGA